MSSIACNCIALVDCNNFYASCERLFNPKIKNQPVAILSNNDGCVISRSEEAKALGVPMGAPFFEVEELMRKKKLHIFSSNYALYGDLSHRVMQTLMNFSPEIEIYSIDEAFLSLKGIQAPHEYIKNIKDTVIKHTGIPVGVGLGPTKVLAKMANRLSKKSGGTFSLLTQSERDYIFPNFPVENIWGIGSRSAIKLKLYNIKTAKDFVEADEKLVEKILTITGKRVQIEMKGIPCLELELDGDDRQQIICSRGFGKPVTELRELQEAVSTYMTRASERLRKNELRCGFLSVFIQTHRHQDNPVYRQAQLSLTPSTNEVTTLTQKALGLLPSIFQSGLLYAKAGVILTDLRREGEEQLSLFHSGSQSEEKKISGLMDQINERFGRDTVKVASCGTKKSWILRSQFKSPAYTTRWDELPLISLN